MRDLKGVVYVVEDDPSFLKSMVRLIRVSGYGAVAFETADAFLRLSSVVRPSCLLLDVRLPGLDGLGLQDRLLEKDIHIPIIFMTGHGNIPMSVKAIKKGATDFLPKPFKIDVLIKAINEALARDIRNAKDESKKLKINMLIDTMTPREKEIMRWIITGKLNKQIAYGLGITEKTVKVHRSRVMQKTKVSSVAELVRLAEQAGIDPAG